MSAEGWESVWESKVQVSGFESVQDEGSEMKAVSTSAGLMLGTLALVGLMAAPRRQPSDRFTNCR